MIDRRGVLRGVALLAVADKVNDGGFAPVARPEEMPREHSVLPPGALDARSLARKCVGCGRCAAECPEGIVRLSSDLKTFGQPRLDFRAGSCLLGCVKCSHVCPTGALQAVREEEKPHWHLGVAKWHRELCLRTTIGEQCQACFRKCPVKAIHIVSEVPVVDEAVCIGCGACEHVCPVRPLAAMQIIGFERPRRILPMGEDDLVSEMRRRLGEGNSLVIARNGVIVEVSDAHRLDPLFAALESGRLANAVVVDKVVGRAAAAIYIVAGVRRVHAALAAEDAAKMLEQARIRFSCDKSVKAILNVAMDGSCPMESAISGLDEPVEMVKVLQQRRK